LDEASVPPRSRFTDAGDPDEAPLPPLDALPDRGRAAPELPPLGADRGPASPPPLDPLDPELPDEG
jgi:hypothetical protein